MSTTSAAMQAATQRAFGQAARHMHRPGFAGPLCGQVNATGKGWARTHYTTDPAKATCKKCAAAIRKQAAAAALQETVDNAGSFP